MTRQYNENEYSEIVERLKVLLNGRIDNFAVAGFRSCLSELDTIFNTQVSTRFLRNLVTGNCKTQGNKVSKILNRAELPVRQENRYYQDFCSNGTIKRRESLSFVVA